MLQMSEKMWIFPQPGEPRWISDGSGPLGGEPWPFFLQGHPEEPPRPHHGGRMREGVPGG